VERFLSRVGMKQRKKYETSDWSFLHPGRQASILYNNRVIGYLGEVHPKVADNYGIGERAYLAVIDMPVIDELASFDRKYTGIVRYPAVTRDISILVPSGVTNGQIEDMLLQRGGKILESLRLFDIYEGAQVMTGYKSMAYSLVFRSATGTLSDDDITAAMKKIWNGLGQMGIEIRS